MGNVNINVWAERCSRQSRYSHYGSYATGCSSSEVIVPDLKSWKSRTILVANKIWAASQKSTTFLLYDQHSNCDQHICTYTYLENRPLIQSLALTAWQVLHSIWGDLLLMDSEMSQTGW